ncbi:acyl-CoA N-acyltransferase [Thelephora ganbajun]|uniref:Acyl-CoA N-acyltransferase n=1 Tax=Thelephora ganbajun TaxID=370292 RepID=A0ACB6Z9M4_THEGA|nr:acyl-CoA N-acyltransferase [Thelephora ganbajun]
MPIGSKRPVRVWISHFLRVHRPTESLAYPADEAGSYETFVYRHSVASSLFLGAYDQSNDGEKRLVGFICSTLSKSEKFTHGSMTTHDPEGKTICIHSVCVDPGYQRRKVGSALLEEYIRRWRDGPYDGISLIAHEELINFYVAVGFKLIRKSEVVHGSKPWFELRYSLQSHIPDAATQRRVLEVLQGQSNQSEGDQPDKKLVSYFPGGPPELADERGLNKLRLYCPRIACRSIILLAKTATLVERSSVTIDNRQNLPPQDLLPHLPAPSESISTWKVGPPANPMVFENIGFSKTLPTDGPPAASDGSRLVKLLTCAECDLGPLGWVEEGPNGATYWLVANRVGYT